MSNLPFQNGHSLLNREMTSFVGTCVYNAINQMLLVKYLISFHSLTQVIHNSFAEELIDILLPSHRVMIYCVQVNKKIILCICFSF